MITIIGILGIMFWGLFYWMLDDIRIELRYKNTLLKEQNDILKAERK